MGRRQAMAGAAPSAYMGSTRASAAGRAVLRGAGRDALADWTFSSTDVEAVPVDHDDFVYADPPYDVEFTQYAKDGFAWEDQERTAVWLSKHRGPVVLVNQATARVEKLYRRLAYNVRFLEAPRRISCTGDRTPAREIMGTRNV